MHSLTLADNNRYFFCARVLAPANQTFGQTFPPICNPAPQEELQACSSMTESLCLVIRTEKSISQRK